MKLDTTKVTLDNVAAQFCSDWLKGELRRLLRKELALAHARGALTVIASNHKPYLVDESFWSDREDFEVVSAVVNDTRCAREALAEIERILGEK